MNRAARVRAPHQRGFTLMELMVSMAILALIMTLAMTSYQYFTNQWERRGGQADPSLATARTLTLLHESVESSFDYYVDSSQSPRQQRRSPFFRGDNERVAFVTLQSLFSPGASAIGQLALEHDADQDASDDEQNEMRLVYREWFLTGRILTGTDLPESEPDQETTVLTGIADGQFRYFGEASYEALQRRSLQQTGMDRDPGAFQATDGQASWHSEYDSIERNLMPRHMQVELQGTGNDHAPLKLHFSLRGNDPRKRAFIQSNQ